MNKHTYIALALLAIGVLAFVASSLIGFEVAPDGTLHEPFFLVIVGYFFLFLGLTWGIIALFTRGMREKRYLPLAIIVAIAVAVILFMLIPLSDELGVVGDFLWSGLIAVALGWGVIAGLVRSLTYKKYWLAAFFATMLALVLVFALATFPYTNNNGAHEPLAFPGNTLDTSDWDTYRNEEFGFEVKYPKNMITVSETRVTEMKEMHEFGFHLNWHLGRVDMLVQSANIGMTMYVYDKDVDTLFEMYSDLNTPLTGTVGNIPLHNAALLFLIANTEDENGDLFRYQRSYFAGNEKRAYEIVPTHIPQEYKKIFHEILLSFTLIK